MKVLIVEDDTSDFNEIASALSTLGFGDGRPHTIIRASALDKAVAELQESVDLVLLDAMFPESLDSPGTAFSAPKVIDQIRRMSPRPMVLVVTGNEKATECSNFSEVERWMDEGLVADVLPAPLPKV